LSNLREESNEASQYLANELEWLYDKGIIFDPEYTSKEIDLENEEYKEILALEKKHTEETQRKLEDVIAKIDEILEVGSSVYALESMDFLFSTLENAQLNIPLTDEYMARRISILLRVLDSTDAYPILSGISSIPSKTSAEKTDVVQIVFNALPFPNDSVSWEQMHEYLSDPDTRSKFLALRNWMNEVTKGGMSNIEIEEKLEYLMDQYRQHMNLHRMKTNASTVETIVVTGAEFLEDLVKFKWGKMARGLFSFKHRRIALIEGELTAPGSEIAYIVKARNTFPDVNC